MMVSLRGGKNESEARESGKRALALECAVEPARSSFDRKTHHFPKLPDAQSVSFSAGTSAGRSSAHWLMIFSVWIGGGEDTTTSSEAKQRERERCGCQTRGVAMVEAVSSTTYPHT